jgi:hypothetical protein
MRFAQQRGGIDLALEHVWRSEGVYSERAFILTLGVSVRPCGRPAARAPRGPAIIASCRNGCTSRPTAAR